MTSPLPPVPRPDISERGMLKAPWQSWFSQLYTYVTAGSSGGGGVTPNTRIIATTAPLSGGGNLTADRTLSILNNGITNALLAQMPAGTIKGNNTGATGNALDLTASQVKSLLAISLTTDVTGTLQAAQEPAHTGDVTNSAGSLALTIATNAVTNAKAAQMANNTLKGNNAGATGNALDLTATQVTAMLNVFTSVLQGLVPASGGGTVKFLRADGAFSDFTSGPFGIGAAPGGTYTLELQVAQALVRLNSTTAATSIATYYAINSVDQGYVGVAGAANAFITGSAAGDFFTRMVSTNVLWSTDNGTSIAMKLGTSGDLTVKAGGGNFLTTTTSLTNGAGASAGTITNAPAAGNPTKWIQINDNGTVRKIPAW